MLFYSFFLILTLSSLSQTRADSLRGFLSPQRSCYDVLEYDLDLLINFSQKSISGSNTISFNVLHDFDQLQVDLFENMIIDSILHDGLQLDFEREYDAVFVKFPWKVLKGSYGEIKIYYHGKPKEAVNPPWDGGFSWKKDLHKRDWLGVSCEGIGASLWWPNKDHLSDEPTKMTMSFTVPSSLTAVSNGRLVSTEKINRDLTKYTYKVVNPINNYNVTLNVGSYAHIADRFVGEKNKLLDLDFYVLHYNKDTASVHFKQVKDILLVFEKYFGPYAFYQDGYKLVETSYWGMEHQSCISYGNNYKNNQWGFDFIILHETAHEWFGNSLSMIDQGEMWLHEAFATYAEALYVEEKKGFYESVKYLISKKGSINNSTPILGPLGVNYEWKDIDIYNKGAWMLHTLRTVIGNDPVWFDIIKEYSITNRRSSVRTHDFVEMVNHHTGVDFAYFFDQYLGKASIPKLECKLEKAKKGKMTLSYRWTNVHDKFVMPIQVTSQSGRYYWIQPSTKWKHKEVKKMSAADFKPATHLFLVDYEVMR